MADPRPTDAYGLVVHGPCTVCGRLTLPAVCRECENKTEDTNEGK